MPSSLRSGRQLCDSASENSRDTSPTVTDETIKQLRRELRDRDVQHAAATVAAAAAAARDREESRRDIAELRALLTQRAEPAGPARVPEPNVQAALPVAPPAAPFATWPVMTPITATVPVYANPPRDNAQSWSAPPASTVATWAGPPAYVQRPAAPPAPPVQKQSRRQEELKSHIAAMQQELCTLNLSDSAPDNAVQFAPVPSPCERAACEDFGHEEAAQRTSRWVNAIETNVPAASWLPSLLNSVAPPPGQIRSVAMLNRTSKSYELEPYSGDAAEWLAFEAQYYKGTEECQYSEVDNHARLGRCLRGWARDLVKDVLIGQVGRADDMMRTLRESCGHPMLVTEAALKSIAAFKPLAAKHNMAQVLDLAILIRNTASMLAAYPTLKMEKGALLMDFVDKLPETYRTHWLVHVDTRLADKPVIQLEDLSDWLKRLRDAGARGGFRPNDLTHSFKRATTLATNIEEESRSFAPRYREPQASAQYREPQAPAPYRGPQAFTPRYHEPQVAAPYREPQAFTPRFQEPQAPTPRPYQREPQAPPPRNAAPQQSKQKRPPNGTCGDCGEPHPIERCKTFQGRKLVQKRELVAKHRLCFLCLQTGHTSRGCLAPKCSECKGDHHRALHPTEGYTSA